MKGVSFLTSLSSYSPRAGRNPREDFFTEALAWLLKEEKELTQVYAKAIAKMAGITLPAAGKIEVRTQVTSDSGRPDMELRGYTEDDENNVSEYSPRTTCWIIAFEHKLDAGEGRRQIERYAEYVNKQACACGEIPHLLVYITRYNNDYIDQQPKGLACKLLSLRWRHVFPVLKNYKYDPDSRNALYLDHLIAFMEEQRMKPVESFTPIQAASVVELPQIFDTLTECLSGDASHAYDQIVLGKQRSDPWSQLRMYGRYGYLKSISDKDASLQLFMGFMIREDDHIKRSCPDYPEMVIFIESSPNSDLRKEYHAWVKKISEQDKNWKVVNGPYQMVCVQTSLAEFLRYGNNQMVEIRKWYSDHLRVLKEQLKPNPIPVEKQTVQS